MLIPSWQRLALRLKQAQYTHVCSVRLGVACAIGLNISSDYESCVLPHRSLVLVSIQFDNFARS